MVLPDLNLEKRIGFDPSKQAFSLLGEFKAFAFKGNVVDLAVGVIIGSAFGKIVDSLVKQVIMPAISLAMPGDQEYTKWVIPNTEIKIGLFLAEVVNFLIVAAVLFFVIVKFLGWLLRTRKVEAAAPPLPPPAQEVLLTEIRDLLQKQLEQKKLD